MTTRIVSGLTQICLVVNDFERSVRDLAEKFSIGPWKCWQYAAPRILDTRRNGQPAPWTLNLGVAWVGDIQLEVIQPTGGPTVYQEYLDAQGEGAQHLMVRTGPGYFDAIRSFEAAGYRSFQSARINPPMQVGPLSLPALPAFLAGKYALQFVYHDTLGALGTILEISKMPPGIPFRLGVWLGKPDFIVDAGSQNGLVRAIDSVGIIVPDIGMAMRRWEGVGLGPWETTNTSDARIACTSLPPTILEIIQPTGPGIYQSLLENHGPGIQYLGISGGSPKDFENAGFPVLGENESGTFIDARRAAHTVFRISS